MSRSQSFTTVDARLMPREDGRRSQALARSQTTSWWILPVFFTGAGMWALIIRAIFF